MAYQPTPADIFHRALEALGYTEDDQSEEAERAKTWVYATFDDDAEWLETSTPDTIRREYAAYSKVVYGR